MSGIREMMEALREAIGKATAGPFKVVDYPSPHDPLSYMQPTDPEQNDGYKVANFYGPDRVANAGLASLANPQTLTLLLQHVEKLEGALHGINSLIGNVDHSDGGGENTARLYGVMLNDIRNMSDAALSGDAL